MTEQRNTPTDMGSDPACKDGDAVEWARVLEDWVTIWQSEMAGLAVDREVQEAVLRGVEQWAEQARATAGALAPLLQAAADERARGRAGTDATAGAAPVDAASAGRDAVIGRLLERVAELERRLDASDPRPIPRTGGV